MKKKLVSVSALLALCIGISTLAGCSGSSSNGSSSSNSAESTSAQEQSSSTEKTTLTIGIFSAGREADKNAPSEYIDDNWSTKYIQENFGKANNIDVKFQIIDNTNDAGNQNLQILMAAQKAPDLFYVTPGEVGQISKYAEQGALADLQPSLDKYGANIKKLLTEDFIAKNGKFSGKQYSIPGQEPIPAISHYWIRTDWLETLGLKMPTTFDEWSATMKAFKDRAPELEKAGRIKSAKDVIPYAMYHTKYFTDWERIVARFYPTKYFDEKNAEYYEYSGYGTEYLKEGFKEGIQFMNQMYTDGLISKNFALDEDQKQFERDIVSGNVGSYCNNLFDGWEPSNPESKQNLCAKNIPGATWEWCNAFTNKYDNMARNPLDNPVLTYIVVPSYSKSIDAAVKYLDWVATGDNMITLQYGEEGKSYEVDPVLGPMKKDEDSLKAWGHKAGGRELVMLGRLPDRKQSRIQRSGARTAEEATNAEKIHLGIEQNGYERFPGILQGASEKSLVENLRTPWTKFISNLIMAKPGDFENVWTSGTKELEANGALTVVDGYKKIIKDQLGIEAK